MRDRRPERTAERRQRQFRASVGRRVIERPHSVSVRALKRARVVLAHVLERSTARRRELAGVTVTGLLLFVASALPIPPRHNPDYGPYGPDKFLHFLGHAGFAGALLAAFDDATPRRSACLAVALSTVYGVGTELLQEGIPGREFERGDVVAGFLGSVVGAASWRRVAARDGNQDGS